VRPTLGHSSAMETQIWAIAVKGTASQSELDKAVSEFGTMHPFKVPGAQLRVGTLDSLMALSDDLVKMDLLAETTVNKMYKTLQDLKPDEEPTINGVPAVPYTMMRWEWEEAKFQLKTPLREMCENITQRITSLDDELKLKMGELNALKGSLQGAERKLQGNLMVRGLADIIQEYHVHESEYMTTVFVVVPKISMKDFEGYYEKMATYVVPRSGKLLHEDTEYGLYSVTLFKKSLEQFQAQAREKRLTLRDFTYSPTALHEEETKKHQDTAALNDCKTKLSTWCQINYAECYSMLLHLKAVRVFVESVLRYGLAATYSQGMVPNFKAFLVQPKRGKSEMLRKSLSALYAVGASGQMMEGEEETVVPGATGEFYPYVYTSIETAPNLNL